MSEPITRKQFDKTIHKIFNDSVIAIATAYADQQEAQIDRMANHIRENCTCCPACENVGEWTNTQNVECIPKIKAYFAEERE